MPDALSLSRSELPEEIATAIRFLTETCLFANRFNDAALINRNVRNGVDALTAAILSRLGEAEAGRDEACRERDDARCVGEANARAADANFDAIEAAETARDVALTHVDRLRAALKPFADVCDADHMRYVKDEQVLELSTRAEVPVSEKLRGRDFRAARTALTEAGRLAIKGA